MLGHNQNPSSQGNYSSPTQIPGLWDSSQGMGGGFFWTFGFKAV
jgi:hypothetical protein